MNCPWVCRVLLLREYTTVKRQGEKRMSKIFWVGVLPPENPSIGDHAQTLAAEKLFNDQFKDYEICKFSNRLEDVKRFFKEDVKPDDLIFIQSGGHFGTLNPPWHKIRKQIIERFPDNKVVQLPVSPCYLGTEGIVLFERDKIFFHNRENLLILGRTKGGTDFLTQNFGCRIKYFPDFVFYLNPELPDYKRRGEALVLRNDDESMYKQFFGKIVERLPCRPQKWLSSLTKKDVPFLLRKLARELDFIVSRPFLSSKFVIKDFQVSDVPITEENRKHIVYSTIKTYRRFSRVVTDRFHGIVFSLLAGTKVERLPCKTPFKSTVQKPNREVFDSFREIIFDSFDKPVEPTQHHVPNDVFSAVMSRRSVRKWTSKPVELPKLTKVLEAGVYAPSACNLQPVRFRLVTDKEGIRFLCENTCPWFKRSFPSAVVLVFYDKTVLPKGWGKRFLWQDTSCAMMNMWLVAESLGLRCCWASVTPVQQKYIANQLDIDKNGILACMLFLGYSNQKVGLGGYHQGRKIRRKKVAEYFI